MKAEKPRKTAIGCIHQASVRVVAPNGSCLGIVTLEAMSANVNDLGVERQRLREKYKPRYKSNAEAYRIGPCGLGTDYFPVMARTAAQRSFLGRSIWTAFQPALRGPSRSLRGSSPTLSKAPA